MASPSIIAATTSPFSATGWLLLPRRSETAQASRALKSLAELGLALQTELVRQGWQTMAEMVEELRRQPSAGGSGSGAGRGLPGGGVSAGVIGPEGTLFAEVVADISPGRALELVRAGALVAWDYCGCRGYCGYDWLDVERRQVLAKAGRPRIGGRPKKVEWGIVSHLRSEAGVELVLAENALRWGGELF